MEEINKWKVLTFESLKEMVDGIAAVLPNIIGAIVILILGWLITQVIGFLLKRVLKLSRVDRLTDKINAINLFKKTDLKFKLSKVIVSFVKWILFLVFLIIASDIMNWHIVSKEIGNLVQYLPKLFSAVALFMIGLYIADFIKKGINGLFESFDLSGSKIIGNVVFYFIVVLITITALNQAGVDTSVVTSNFSIVLGAFLLAISIGFGLGSKDVIGDLLRMYYARKNYEIGDKVKINGSEGVIKMIDNISLTLTTEKGKIIIPIKDVVQSEVEVTS
ncbi:mechanosensitive ion channel family protein [Spongiimicrobium sp. 3-5]|uniref:mechanosensitive ion channel family protein n=1 Tax=Spongiimicrobium sp. 3-5 TaxID=3332596 RepID=UPI00397EC2A4